MATWTTPYWNKMTYDELIALINTQTTTEANTIKKALEDEVTGYSSTLNNAVQTYSTGYDYRAAYKRTRITDPIDALQTIQNNLEAAISASNTTGQNIKNALTYS